MIKYLRKLVVLFLLLMLAFNFSSAQTFVHPGLLHKQSDFDRMASKVKANAQPWKSGYDKLVANSHSSSTYSLQGPKDTVYRGSDGVHAENFSVLFNDIAAAYANALRWKVGGTTANADKAVQILNAWGSTLKALGGSVDVDLSAGIYGYQLANAAEIMRDYSGWAPSDFVKFKSMMVNVFYSVNHDFLVRHNGQTDPTVYWANWDLCNMASMLSIGVLCDDAAKFNESIAYFKTSIGNGQIDKVVNYLYDGNLGQWQESGRDQGHCTLGPALIGPFCEAAWNQGIDLYGYEDNRLWKGFEYVAKYNLGNAVPFTTYHYTWDNTDQIVTSINGRGTIRPAWELIYNHYVNLKGMYSPYIQVFASVVRPEGGGGDYGSTSGGFDQLGYGTLTATLETPVKKSQTLSFPSLTAMVVGDNDKDPGAVASSGILPIYTSSNPEVAEIVNNKIHVIKCGTSTITAYQVGDDVYAQAPIATQIITVTDPNPVLAGSKGMYVSSTGMAIDVSGASLVDGASVIQWNGTGGTNQQWIFTNISGNNYKIINVKSGKALDVVGNSNTAGALIEQRTYSASDQYQIWTITDNCDETFRLVNVGNGLTLSVTASSTTAGATYCVNTYTGVASQKFTFWNLISAKTSQTIAFKALAQKNRGDVDFAPGASSNSGLVISYSSTNPAVATIIAGNIHVVGGGTTSIIASQGGNATYDAALDVQQQLIVTKQDQTITFPTLPVIRYRDADVDLGATASSGLAVTYTSSDPTIASIVSGKIHVISTGTTTISASQFGDSIYNPAPQINQTLNVLKLDQTISFPTLPPLKVGDADYAPGGTSSSGMTVSYKSSNSAVATILSSKIHVVGEGTTLITATQSGDTKRYNAAPDSVQTLVVLLPNGINSLNAHPVKMFPNPTTGEFSISFPEGNTLNATILITDLLGRQVIILKNCSIENKISLKSCPNGMYVVRIKFDDQLVSEKIIKQ